MDFDAAVLYMHGRLRFGVKLGNARFLALLERLGNPQDAVPVVHIAGTKGKGSTASMAASMLRASGRKTGLYLSPFVYDVRERVQIDGEAISREDFARLVTEISPHVEAVEKTDHGPVTEFEMKTAVGFLHFAQQNADCAVIEVGLGGRLDATNVVSEPLITVITNIDLDHTELLGNTQREIAGEKAGIVKPGIPCVTGVPRGGEAAETIEAICAKRGAPLSYVSLGRREAKGDSAYLIALDGTTSISTPRRALSRIKLRMAGAFQSGNAAVALAALDSIPESRWMPLSDDAAVRGLEMAYAPGRFERVADKPIIVVDVAHNELSARVLAESLIEYYRADIRRTVFVVGLSKNHAPETFLPPLRALNPALLIATQPNFSPRDASEIERAARDLGFREVRLVTESVRAAMVEAIASSGPDDLICLTGSFYTVGDVPPNAWSELLSAGLVSGKS